MPSSKVFRDDSGLPIQITIAVFYQVIREMAVGVGAFEPTFQNPNSIRAIKLNSANLQPLTQRLKLAISVAVKMTP